MFTTKKPIKIKTDIINLEIKIYISQKNKNK